jgi:type I restriction enzyme M protein
VLKNNINFNALKGKTKIQDQKWKDLLDHFNQPRFVLVNDHFEFPDLLGAAYEYLIKFFADSAGWPASRATAAWPPSCPMACSSGAARRS